MNHVEYTVSELSFLLKLLPVMQDVESVDKIYRMLLAVTTAGRTIGFRRAMIFEVDNHGEAVRGKYGSEHSPGEKETGNRRPSFEEMAREVFENYENIESNDLTLKVKTFSVPLGWQRSALVKAVLSNSPVLADSELSEFTSDPYFAHFEAASYIAVPLKLGDSVRVVLAADNGGDSKPIVVDDVSILYSLSQQAALSVEHLIESSDNKRRFRILWKLQQTLSDADTKDKIEEGLKLALVMITRAVEGSGCFLKDSLRHKTFHIKPVQEFSPQADEDDVAISECFDEILERASSASTPISGDHLHPLLSSLRAKSVRFFFACPLTVKVDVVGALAVYIESDELKAEPVGFRGSDKRFLELCAGLIASKLDGTRREERASRMESFLDELSSNLVRERAHSRVGDRGIEFYEKITEELTRVRQILSEKGTPATRLSEIAEVVNSMEHFSRNYHVDIVTAKTRFEMVDLFELTRGIVERWKEGLEKRGIELTVRIPFSGPSLLVARDKLSTALFNIFESTASGLRNGDKVLVECSANDSKVYVCVADTGEGLPGDTLSRLFMPFSEIETEDERKRALSLAGEILQKHAGEIMIKSSTNWKTILILSFPRSANKDRRRGRRDRRRGGDRRMVVKTPRAGEVE